MLIGTGPIGSESGAKIYSSIPEANAIDAPLNLTANLPTAVVDVIDTK